MVVAAIPHNASMAMRTQQVTYTILEDGMYLPSVGAVLPEGVYLGEIMRNGAGEVVDATISLNRIVLDLIRYDPSVPHVRWSIIRDYRAGLIGEDRDLKS